MPGTIIFVYKSLNIIVINYLKGCGAQRKVPSMQKCSAFLSLTKQ